MEVILCSWQQKWSQAWMRLTQLHRQLFIHVFFDYYENGEMLQATTTAALTDNDFGRMDTRNG